MDIKLDRYTKIITATPLVLGAGLTLYEPVAIQYTLSGRNSVLPTDTPCTVTLKRTKAATAVLCQATASAVGGRMVAFLWLGSATLRALAAGTKVYLAVNWEENGDPVESQECMVTIIKAVVSGTEDVPEPGGGTALKFSINGSDELEIIKNGVTYWVPLFRR